MSASLCRSEAAKHPKTATECSAAPHREREYWCEVGEIQSYAGAMQRLDVAVRCTPVDVHGAGRRRDGREH
jgi:hypothetical protein